jgi:hypothetical protein
MSAFDDIADEDLQDQSLPLTASFAPNAVAEESDIQAKCNELLRVARDINLRAHLPPQSATVMQELWLDVRGREQLLSSGREDAECLADMAQQVRTVCTASWKHNDPARSSWTLRVIWEISAAV